MAEIIDNAGASMWSKLYFQREQDGPWETLGVVQRTAHVREIIRKAVEAGKAPKFAYRIEASEALHPMPESVRVRLRENGGQENGTAERDRIPEKSSGEIPA